MKKSNLFLKFLTFSAIFVLVTPVVISTQSSSLENRSSIDSVSGLFDPAYYEIGFNKGDTHTLEIHYINSEFTNLEIGSKMYYYVADITSDICYFLETVNYANGSLAYDNDYNDSRADIQMPFFYTTINVTLLTETLNSSEYTVTADSDFITIEQDSDNSGDVTNGVYVFHRSTGWLYSYVATMTANGSLLMEIDMRDIDYIETTTTETTEEPTTYTTTEESTTTTTTSTDDSTTESDTTETTDDSTTETADDSSTLTTTTTIPEISPSSGLLSLIVLGTVSLVYRKRKG
ncbi:MAG: hypothetical protein ACW97Z_16015 [Candidatus Hodarchaeales archaeon]|jgi:hypothetical protein